MKREIGFKFDGQTTGLSVDFYTKETSTSQTKI